MEAYSLDAERRRLFPRMLCEQARGAHRWARSAAEADPLFPEFWEGGIKERMPRAEVWMEHEAPAIARQLALHPDGELCLALNSSRSNGRSGLTSTKYCL